MADRNSTTPFASQEERDNFGKWLSGFVDGEGSFILGHQTNKTTSRRRTGMAKFVIALRDDDRAIVEQIRDFLGCGVIQNRRFGSDNPQSRLDVSKVEDLVNIVIPTFERYPLRAKKRRDFPLWRRGVELIYRVSRRPTTVRGRRGFQTKWTDAEIAEYLHLSECMNTQRRYMGEPAKPMPPRSFIEPTGPSLFDRFCIREP